MKLRSKLSLGIGILFTLILIQGIQSIRYVRHLSVSSKEILSDNYNSVHYVSEMLRSLDRFSQDSASRRTLIEAFCSSRTLRRSTSARLPPPSRRRSAGSTIPFPEKRSNKYAMTCTASWS